MNLPDLKQLNKIIALCRKQGVLSIKIDNIELVLREEAPQKPMKASPSLGIPSQGEEALETDGPTMEQLIAWSSQTEEGANQ